MGDKYTLDRVDDFFAVFLSKADETKRLLVSKNLIKVPLREGDLVEIDKSEIGYEIKVLKEETEATREKVSSLLEKLKTNKHLRPYL
ncbi:DUF3006 domain-containing protein [Psychrobacillus sp. FSL H8-0487]|uniref:DUF3006 domain-containing protein n=1 Tax=Psychrobacillus sp. FSL H8-0487 TaxID=2921391 RepID=UPI0030F6214E